MTAPDDKPINHGNSRMWVAIVLVVIGAALLLQQMGVVFPFWLFTWPMLLIVIGISMGLNHGFRGAGWLIIILVGSFFLLDDILTEFPFRRYAWPVAIIAVGLVLLLRPRHRGRHWGSEWEQKWKERYQHKWQADTQQSHPAEDFFDSTSIFGGVKKVILSKNFQGGDITCIMGGSEIDLTQADIQGRASIEVTQIFGGTKLIVPSNWKVTTQMTALFGSIEDKRKQPVDTTSDKVLIIQGVSIFGGIEIRSY